MFVYLRLWVQIYYLAWKPNEEIILWYNKLYHNIQYDVICIRYNIMSCETTKKYIQCDHVGITSDDKWDCCAEDKIEGVDKRIMHKKRASFYGNKPKFIFLFSLKYVYYYNVLIRHFSRRLQTRGGDEEWRQGKTKRCIKSFVYSFVHVEGMRSDEEELFRKEWGLSSSWTLGWWKHIGISKKKVIKDRQF